MDMAFLHIRLQCIQITQIVLLGVNGELAFGGQVAEEIFQPMAFCVIHPRSPLSEALWFEVV